MSTPFVPPAIPAADRVSLANSELFAMPDSIRLFRRWPGSRSGTAWRAAMYWSLLPARSADSIGVLVRHASDFEAIANSYWLKCLADFRAAVAPGLLEADALLAVAATDRDQSWQALVDTTKPTTPMEAAIWIAIWQRLAAPAGSGDPTTAAADHGHLLQVTIGNALEARDTDTLRAFVSAPSVFGLGLGQDPVQHELVLKGVAPQAFARWAELRDQVAFGEALAYAVRGYIEAYSGPSITRTNISQSAAEMEREARLDVTIYDGSVPAGARVPAGFVPQAA